MSNQLQFVAFDFFNIQPKTYFDEILQIPELSCSHSSSSSTFMDQEDSTSKEIFINQSFSTHPSETPVRNTRNQTKSVLHNMQKHFFTFIQYLTPKTPFIIENLNGSSIEVLKCSKQLAKIIKSQKRKTKEDLVPIFGEFDQKRVSKQNSIYKEMTQKYSTIILKESLGLLKEHYLLAIKSGNVISEYLENSKMERKTEFKKYIESFIVEVETNKFKFRLTKESQEKIRNETKQDKNSAEEWEEFFSLS